MMSDNINYINYQETCAPKSGDWEWIGEQFQKIRSKLFGHMYFGLVSGFLRGTAWRRVLCRQATRTVQPSFWVLMNCMAVMNTRQAMRTNFGSILVFWGSWVNSDWGKRQ